MVSEAESLVELYLGYSISPKEHTDHLKLGKYGFELNHSPFISLVSVQARTDKWGVPGMELGESVWVGIPLEQIQVFERDSITFLLVPPTLFGTGYTEIKVTYKSGLTEVPEKLKQAIETVSALIDKGEIDSWNRQLPLEILEVTDSYKKEDK